MSVSHRYPRHELFHRRYASFWAWFSGQTVSVVGTNVSLVALPWIVLTLTHSAFTASLTMAMEFVPYLLFSVVAGAVADRGNRKFILLLTNLLQALVLFTIPVAWALHSLTMGQIYWVTFLNSTLAVWYNAANQSVVPTLLPTHLIHPANTVLQLGNSIGSLVGTPLGGILLTIMSGP